MTPFELRPLAIGELLDRVFTLYRRHLSTFVGIMAIPSIFSLALALLVLTLQHLQGPLVAPNRRFNPDTMTTELIEMGAGYLVAIVLYWITYMLALGGSMIAVAEIYAGREIGIGGAYARARQQLGRLLLLGLLWFVVIVLPGFVVMGVGLVLTIVFRTSGAAAAAVAIIAVMLGMLVFLATTIFLSLRYAVSAPALVLEGVSAPQALRRSAFLTRGFFGRVFLVGLCSALLAYTAIMLFQVPFNIASVVAGPLTVAGFWLAMVGAVAGTMGQTLTSPIMVIGVAVLYYDFRVRKEALDLQVMMSALDSQDGGLSMTPPPSPALPR